MSLKKVPRLFQQKKDNDFSVSLSYILVLQWYMFLQVLEEDQHQLRLQVKHKRETTEFKSKLALYYYRVIERIFIVIVLIDAVLTATKFSGINTTHAEFLKYWQVCAMAKHDIVYMPCMCQYNNYGSVPVHSGQ